MSKMLGIALRIKNFLNPEMLFKRVDKK